jgi:demethylmenaquinone methyltransferase/2-methoxy-6-polyprenyl-1,4-benzoquinol methylase
MFGRIAHRYDLVNAVVSLGRDRRWRREALELAGVKVGAQVLDVATGTGDVALTAAQGYPRTRVVGLDLTPPMVERAREKDAGRKVTWIVGDGLRLPFPAGTFDAVVSAFMMRNVTDVEGALREQRRVARSGARVVCLEITWPRRFPVSQLFRLYFFGLSPLVGALLSGESAAYRYLPRSVHAFMSPEELAGKMEGAGLEEVRWHRRMLGTVTLHVGTTPHSGS